MRCWLVERQGMFLGVDTWPTGVISWRWGTAAQAVRFARKEDADMVARVAMRGTDPFSFSCAATEHLFGEEGKEGAADG